MDSIAMIIGYCMIGLIVFFALLWLLAEFCGFAWRRIQNAYGLWEVVEAVKAMELQKKERKES